MAEANEIKRERQEYVNALFEVKSTFDYEALAEIIGRYETRIVRLDRKRINKMKIFY